MLTSDLIRVTTRQGKLHPRWVKTEEREPLELASQVLDLFAHSVGETVQALEESLNELPDGPQQVQLVRGLAKVCWEQATLESPVLHHPDGSTSPLTPLELRQLVFTRAAQQWPVRPGGGDGFHARESLLSELAAELHLSAEQLEQGLYADLKSAQRLVGFPEGLQPAELLARYNLALAQACLLRATSLTLEWPEANARQTQALFRTLKFRRLLARQLKAKPLTLQLDGPLSLHSQTSRYGLQLAQALPALIRAERYTLTAELKWGREAKPLTLTLTQASPIAAHTPEKGTWESSEEAHFRASFEALDTAWRLEPSAELIDLGGEDVLVPDYLLSHPDGRKAYLEIVFSWRRTTFERRTTLLKRFGPANLILAIAEKGRLDAKDSAKVQEKGLFETGLPTYAFKGIIQPKRVLALAEEHAKARVK